MKLLVREQGRLVFQLTARDRNSLLGILRFGSEWRRRPPRFTRGPVSFVPSDAGELLRESVQEHRVQIRDSTLSWLENTARCVPGKGGFGLTLSETEAEILLQALNGAKIGFWEALGCPNPNDRPPEPPNAEGEALAYAMELANAYIDWLVDCLSAGPRKG